MKCGLCDAFGDTLVGRKLAGLTGARIEKFFPQRGGFGKLALPSSGRSRRLPRIGPCPQDKVQIGANLQIASDGSDIFGHAIQALARV